MRRSQKMLTLLRIQFESANQKKLIFGRYQSYKRRKFKKSRVALGTRMRLDVVRERWKVRIFICQFFPSFAITEFLFIKINQNCCFAGNVSDDNAKDHEVYNVIDRLV